MKSLRRLAIAGCICVLVVVLGGCVSGATQFRAIADEYSTIVLPAYLEYVEHDETLSATQKAAARAHAEAILRLAREGSR